MFSTMRALGLVGAVVVFAIGCGDPDASQFGGAHLGGAPGRGGSAVAAGGASGRAGAGGGPQVVPGTGGMVALGSGGAAGAPIVGTGGSGATAAGGGRGPWAGAAGAGGAHASGGSMASGGSPGTGGKLGGGGAVGSGGAGTAGRGGATATGTGGASSGGARGTGGSGGVCRPGDASSCQGVSCMGTATCSAAGQWGECPCSPPGTGGAGGAGGAGGTCTETPGPPSSSGTCPQNPDGSGANFCGAPGKVCWSIGVCGSYETRCVTPCSAITCASDQVKQQDLGQDCKCVAGPPPPPPPTFHSFQVCEFPLASYNPPMSCAVPGGIVGTTSIGTSAICVTRTGTKTAPDGTKFYCTTCGTKRESGTYELVSGCALTDQFCGQLVYCAATCSDCDP